MSEAKKSAQIPTTFKSIFSIGGMLIVLVILVLINVIFSQFNIRWDATKDKLYSLSDGTKTILSNLEKDVTIKLFYTKDNPNTPLHIKTYANRLTDFLSEYEYYSKGKVTVEVLDVKPDSEEEEWAQKYGIDPIDMPTGDRIYFGLVAMAADQEETIPTIDPTREENLEYDITRMISRVQSPKKSKIGIISSLPVMGQRMPQFGMQRPQGSPPWVFVTELQKNYIVEEIQPTAETIEKDIDLLMIIHPKELSETLQYAIDQYILRGGNAIVFIDPMATADESQGYVKSSSLDKLMTAWGVTTESGKVLVDFDNPTRVRAMNNQPEDNPMWLTIRSDGFNSNNIITSKLESVLLPVAGVLKKLPDSTYDYEPLIQSSQKTSLTESFRANFGAAQIRRDFTSSNIKYDLAVKIRGTFKTAFPDGKPKPSDKDPNQPPIPSATSDESLKSGKDKATIILVADTDLLYDSYFVSKQNFLGFQISRVFNDNLNFVLNACEMLTGSEALIGIRSRGKFERPFTTVQNLEKKAQEKWLAREQELVKEVEETNRRLRELEQKKDSSQKFIVSAEQEAEIKQFQEKKLKINKELKDVRKQLRADIESLGNKLKFINIFLMPLLVSIGGLAYGLYRRKKAFRS